MGDRYRKKTVDIEAKQLENNGVSAYAIVEWIRSTGQEALCGRLPTGENMSEWYVLIRTREGDMRANPGDWIIREPFPTDDRRFRPCKPEVFEATYEPIEPTPQEDR